MIIAILLAVLAAAPLVAVAGTLLVRAPRFSEWINLLASVASFVSALTLVVVIDGQTHHYWNNYVVIDRMSAWVILCTSIVYLLASIYAIGYMRLLQEDERLFGFYALFAGFGFTTLVGPLFDRAAVSMTGRGLLAVAPELEWEKLKAMLLQLFGYGLLELSDTERVSV